MITLFITLTIFFGLLSIILGFTTYNLLRKNERQEDIMVGYLNYLDQLSRAIEISDAKLKNWMKEEYLNQMMKLDSSSLIYRRFKIF